MKREEMLDVLDENGIKTGQILPRSLVHKRGLWHRAIAVAIINENNEILLQQRSATKDKNANMWDISVAGHISTGQDSLSAATRKINEEVSVSLGSFRKEQKFSDELIERQFYDFFILRKNDIDINKTKFQESEVQAIKFVNINELNEMREQNLLVERDACYDELSAYLFRI